MNRVRKQFDEPQRLVELAPQLEVHMAESLAEAADAVEIIVEAVPINRLKTRALETWYEERAKAGKKAAVDNVDTRRGPSCPE